MFEEIDEILANRERNFPNDLLRARDILLKILGEESSSSEEK